MGNYKQTHWHRRFVIAFAQTNPWPPHNIEISGFKTRAGTREHAPRDHFVHLVFEPNICLLLSNRKKLVGNV